eukprot:15363057-Alexandrium_andersonii.AAC.1
MSASLVGSEMCIRDRSVLSIILRPTRNPMSAVARQGYRKSFGTPRLATVSYTHLTLPTICSV